MGSNWLFNAPIYFVANLAIGDWISLSTFKFIMIGLLGIASASYLISYLMKRGDIVTHRELRGDLLYAGLFLCAPAFNAWYLVWLLPFAVIRPSVWAWVLSVSIMLSYASGINIANSNLEPYEHSGLMLTFEFIPPLLAAILMALQKNIVNSRAFKNRD